MWPIAVFPMYQAMLTSGWVNQFLAGENREKWKLICGITEDFSRAVMAGDYEMAAAFMNKETGLRLEMTPDVLDGVGHKPVQVGKGKRVRGKIHRGWRWRLCMGHWPGP